MKKIDRLSAPGFLVFTGQPRVFATYEEAERFASHSVRDGEERYATILGNTTDTERTLMEQALIMVDRGVALVTSEEAIKDGFLEDGDEEDWG